MHFLLQDLTFYTQILLSHTEDFLQYKDQIITIKGNSIRLSDLISKVEEFLLASLQDEIYRSHNYTL